jgi:hypothetical protein
MIGYSQIDGVDTQSIMYEDYKMVENYHSRNTTTFKSNYGTTIDNSMLGPGLMLGGATFLLAGILTSSNRVPGTSQSHFYDINRYMAIGTGSLLLASGIVVTIALK